MRRALGFLLLLLLLLAMPGFTAPPRDASPAPITVIRLEGTIDVPSAEYLTRALKSAEREGAQALLILLNTPGGLSEPMKGMTEALLNSPVPSIVYVSPAGAYAMSAGTFITLAANVAAMHPATSIGAAHPVDLLPAPKMPAPEGEQQPGKPAEQKQPAAASQDVMAQKVTNAFALQARVIAETRGRNADWAEQAVRESATLSAKEAVRQHVVDLTADSVPDLFAKLEGRVVTLPHHRVVTLHTNGAPIREIPPSIKESFLHVLANPNILLVLLVLAGLGIMFEMQNPGAILPGVIGGLCLLLSLYSMAALPVNYAGVGLIAFAMLLFLAEVKVPSHGILTVGGVISFIIGALMLMDTTLAPALRVSWQVIIVMTMLLLLFVVFVIGAAVRAHLRKVRTGEQGMQQARGRALGELNPVGEVFVEGERWRARAVEGIIREGEEIEVVGQQGLLLTVRKWKQQEPA